MALYALLVSFILSFILAPFAIRFIKARQFGQSIREDGPKSHLKKTGTPTLGGFIFLFGTVISTIIFVDFSFEIAFILTLMVGYGLIGFLDDYIKISTKKNLGLTVKQKLGSQILLSIFAYLLLYFNDIDTNIHFPLMGIEVELGWLYAPFLLFLVIGTTNATNLTDGLDGLLSGTSIISFLAFGFIAYQLEMSNVLIFVAALIGGLAAFLFFNRYPAQIFMGDTGSLAIGGALVAISIITKTEIFLAIIGAVFVFETLSVIIQVTSFKMRKRRVFKMTPIHHHFEEIGWNEQRVVSTFYLFGTIFALGGMLLFAL